MAVTSCKKLIEIPPPVGSITTTQVFSSDDQAKSAVAGMYYRMINIRYNYSSGGLTIFPGMSADELIPFDKTANSSYVEFLNNKILTSDSYLLTDVWGNVYSTIYAANAILAGLQASTGVHDAVKTELSGEAKFIRAFCDFYLVNLYGDVPLVTSINWHKTGLLSRIPQSQVYDAIIADLKDAEVTLKGDYSEGGGQRIVPNKWAARALLARVYLYTGQWANAEAYSGQLIANSGLFALEPDLNNVFLTGSQEAIWQFQIVSTAAGGTYNATPEGYIFIPPVGNSPFVFLTGTLLNAFEPNDQRKTNWINQMTYLGKTYYYPYKYKVGPDQAKVNGPVTEYYMVLRLAEQYLIKAEAEAHGAGGGLSAAIVDLNAIRNRAGLPAYSGAASTTPLLSAIIHERQVELFAEWGHRWFDLKRLGISTSVLSADKGFTVNNNALLYPIPVAEIITDPNLKQNPGY